MSMCAYINTYVYILPCFNLLIMLSKKSRDRHKCVSSFDPKTMNKYATLTYLHVYVHTANRCRKYINIYILTFINICYNFLYIKKIGQLLFVYYKRYGENGLVWPTEFVAHLALPLF